MQQSTDGVTWQDKGKVVVGHYLNVWFESEHEEWSEAALADTLAGSIYYVRVSRTGSTSYADITVDNSVQIGLSVCELVNSAFEEHFQITFAPHDDEKGTILGLSPHGSAYTKTRAAALDACTTRELLASRFALLQTPLKHQPVIHDKPPSRPATFGVSSNDDTIYQHVNQMAENVRKQEENRRRKDADPDSVPDKQEEEKSWFERYWVCCTQPSLFYTPCLVGRFHFQLHFITNTTTPTAVHRDGLPLYAPARRCS